MIKYKIIRGVVMAIYESGEMYLENILILHEKSSFVRAIDICKIMNLSKPSVSRAMKLLKNQGYITIDSEGEIDLTESGRVIAEKIYERHRLLSSLLISLGVNEETAVNDACKIEHDISDETFEIIKQHINKK